MSVSGNIGDALKRWTCYVNDKPAPTFEWNLDRLDLTSLESSRNKIDECRFFLDLASREQDRAKFRWLLSAFLNAAYSYFEMAAVEAHFKFCGEDGEPYADAHALKALEQHVIVERNRAGRVKTIAVTPTVKKLFDIRKGNTHHFPLAIIEARSPLPEG